MNNKIKFSLFLLTLLFSVFFFYGSVQADGVVVSDKNISNGQLEDGAFNDGEELKDDKGKVLGAYEAGSPNNLIKFYFFVIFAIFFFLILFWIVNEKERGDQF